MSLRTPRPSLPAPRNTPRPRLRPRYRAARAFYLTLFLGTCLATFALLSQPPSQPAAFTSHHALHTRQAKTALNEDEQCRQVHNARDQCAFVKRECPNEEPGFTAYLDLYYCRLAHVKPVAFMILISWLGLLFSTIGIAASDFFCINLSTIASILGMSESVAGVTFLAFGNGSPDVFSTFAAMSTNSGSLAVGELFGAAGFITAVVAGSMALIRPFHVARKSFIRDVGFFVVAAAFSIVFLWDGKLNFWECATMVGYYVFYVVFVVTWHWWMGRRRRRREKEAAARGHFVLPEELEPEEEGGYHDDPEDAPSRPPPSRGVSREDWSALERGGEIHQEQPDEDEEEHARDRWMSELSSNMRLTRPSIRARKNTVTPVRPSLVGALEFQAVLKSLQKSRNIQTFPLNSRRFSDDPTYTTAQQQDQMSTLSDPAARPTYEVAYHDDSSPTLERHALDVPQSAPARNRAVSANDAHSLRIDPDLQRQGRSRRLSREEENLIDLLERDPQAQRQRPPALEVPRSGREPPSPSVQISPATPPLEPPFLSRSPERLPSAGANALAEPLPEARSLPRIVIPGRERSRSRSPTPKLSPFPRYHDDPSSPSLPRSSSYGFPSPSSPESIPVSQSAEQEMFKRPSFIGRWWPYSVLPPPGVLISTVFPTIYHWSEKNYWEKLLGVVAAPSVFLLTITLPVVENGKDDEEMPAQETNVDAGRSKSFGGTSRRDNTNSSRQDILNNPAIHEEGSAAIAGAETHHHRPNGGPSIVVDEQHLSSSPTENTSPPLQPALWNRWLLITQLFLAPIFVVLSIYSQSPIGISPSWLIKPTLICLLVSLVLLIPLLLTTTPFHKPHIYRYILSLAGFVVSIAWISTVASQVVGALKALAVILNMSHAIMGLTIFAVGNSLGDLVADVTVARLGYPVMALSACFGGPMLNILLGIGLSGSWILIRGAQNRVHKHPDKDFRFKSYHIEVSNTLIVSGATLLVTLVGLLIAVPLNKWVLSKRIGWALIALWTLSTIGNVVIEVSGLGESGSETVGVW